MPNQYDAAPTVRLAAEPWTLDDGLDDAAIAAMTRWLADPLVARSMNRDVTKARGDLIAGFRASLAGRGWMMFLRETPGGRPVGYALVEVSPSNGVANLEFIVGEPDVDPRGALDATVLAIGPWLFEVQQVRKIAVQIRDANRAMRSWLEGVMTLEGVLRGNYVDARGRTGDVMVYGVLRSEWRNAVAAVRARPYPRMRRRKKGS